MQAPEPQEGHRWLHRLVGEWRWEMEASMGPDQPPAEHEGTESVRPLGELWTIGEGSSQMPDGGPATTIMTLGYDPERQRFVGTFVGSMMTHLWIYEGTLDEAGKVLTLDAEGPDFSGEGKMAKYQDVIEWVSDDHRVLRSRMLGDDGEWRQFMEAH
ncbi:MAG TPA: DUF1579 domain-containing protein, partial [Thermoanaerobaculia bacterium]